MLQPEEAAESQGAHAKGAEGGDEDGFEVFRDVDEEEQGPQGRGEAGGAVGVDVQAQAEGAWPKPGYYDMQKRWEQKVTSGVGVGAGVPVR